MLKGRKSASNPVNWIVTSLCCVDVDPPMRKPKRRRDTQLDSPPTSSTNVIWPSPVIPPHSHTSEQCFHTLIKTIDSFPAEGFVDNASRLLQAYSWICRLKFDQLKQVMLRIPTSLDSKLGSQAEWSLKMKYDSEFVPWGYKFVFSCRRRGKSKPKEGASMRNRINFRAGCTRSVTIGRTVKFRNFHKKICRYGLDKSVNPTEENMELDLESSGPVSLISTKKTIKEDDLPDE